MINAVLGIILVCFLNIIDVIEYKEDYKGQPYFKSIEAFPIGFALGGILVADDAESLKHEYGHYIQEQKLGIYYLPLVGSTSIIGNFLSLLPSIEYHKIWSEAWADRLGGMEWR